MSLSLRKQYLITHRASFMKKLQFKSQITSTRLADDVVKKMLDQLKKYPPFNNFYSENKIDIDKLKINWNIYEKMRENGVASPTSNSITLKKYPRSIADARIVAHEIEHLLIWNFLKYPYIFSGIQGDDAVRNERKKFVRGLHDIIFEPMVEARLKKYFENLCSDNQKNSMNKLNRINEKKRRDSR